MKKNWEKMFFLRYLTKCFKNDIFLNSSGFKMKRKKNLMQSNFYVIIFILTFIFKNFYSQTIIRNASRSFVSSFFSFFLFFLILSFLPLHSYLYVCSNYAHNINVLYTTNKSVFENNNETKHNELKGIEVFSEEMKNDMKIERKAEATEDKYRNFSNFSHTKNRMHENKYDASFNQDEGKKENIMNQWRNREFKEMSYSEIISILEDLSYRYQNILAYTTAKKEFKDVSFSAPWYLCNDDKTNKILPCEIPIVIIGEKTKMNVDTPEILIIGSLHGDERLGPNIVTELAIFLCMHYDVVPEIHYLLNTRAIYLMPFPNSWGYSHNSRTENSIDPNRDFPYLVNSSNCMRSFAARSINELFRKHLFQTAITFHGGMRILSYPWGSFDHSLKLEQNSLTNTEFNRIRFKSKETPDQIAMFSVASFMKIAAGKEFYSLTSYGNKNIYAEDYFKLVKKEEESKTETSDRDNAQRTVWYYPVSDISLGVYPLFGSMEDWAYSGSWQDSSTINVCNPKNMFYETSKTSYSNSTLRCLLYLVETDNMKKPTPYAYGRGGELYEDSVFDGQISRNIKLSLKLIEITHPDFLFYSLPLSDTFFAGDTLRFSGFGTGCVTMNSIQFVLVAGRCKLRDLDGSRNVTNDFFKNAVFVKHFKKKTNKIYGNERSRPDEAKQDDCSECVNYFGEPRKKIVSEEIQVEDEKQINLIRASLYELNITADIEEKLKLKESFSCRYLSADNQFKTLKHEDKSGYINFPIKLPENLKGDFCGAFFVTFDQEWAFQNNPDPPLKPQTHVVRARIDDSYFASTEDGKHIVKGEYKRAFPCKVGDECGFNLRLMSNNQSEFREAKLDFYVLSDRVVTYPLFRKRKNKYFDEKKKQSKIGKKINITEIRKISDSLEFEHFLRHSLIKFKEKNDYRSNGMQNNERKSNVLNPFMAQLEENNKSIKEQAIFSENVDNNYQKINETVEKKKEKKKKHEVKDTTKNKEYSLHFAEKSLQFHKSSNDSTELLLPQANKFADEETTIFLDVDFQYYMPGIYILRVWQYGDFLNPGSPFVFLNGDESGILFVLKNENKSFLKSTIDIDKIKHLKEIVGRAISLEYYSTKPEKNVTNAAYLQNSLNAADFFAFGYLEFFYEEDTNNSIKMRHFNWSDPFISFYDFNVSLFTLNSSSSTALIKEKNVLQFSNSLICTFYKKNKISNELEESSSGYLIFNFIENKENKVKITQITGDLCRIIALKLEDVFVMHSSYECCNDFSFSYYTKFQWFYILSPLSERIIHINLSFPQSNCWCMPGSQFYFKDSSNDTHVCTVSYYDETIHYSDKDLYRESLCSLKVLKAPFFSSHFTFMQLFFLLTVSLGALFCILFSCCSFIRKKKVVSTSYSNFSFQNNLDAACENEEETKTIDFLSRKNRVCYADDMISDFSIIDNNNFNNRFIDLKRNYEAATSLKLDSGSTVNSKFNNENFNLHTEDDVEDKVILAKQSSTNTKTIEEGFYNKNILFCDDLNLLGTSCSSFKNVIGRKKSEEL